MTTPDDGKHPDDVDPDFAGLFRPEEVAPRQINLPVQPPVEAEPAGSQVQPVEADPVEADESEESLFAAILDPVVDPRVEEAMHAGDGPAGEAAEVHPVAPVSDTGRLFRSRGVEGHSEAVLALPSDHFGRLRTLERRTDAEPVVAGDGGPLIVDQPRHGSHGDSAPDRSQVNPRRSRRDHATSRRLGRISGGAVYLVILGVTLLVGFADALLTDGEIGWPTGMALLLSSVYAALTVRTEDDTLAFILPPVAFLLTAMTAGQLFLGSAEGTLLNRAVVVFFILADNWYWVIGSTVAALVIVLVRRRREAF